MDTRFKVLLVSKDSSFKKRLNSILNKKFHVVESEDTQTAANIISKSEGDVGVVLINITEFLDCDPANIIRNLRKDFYPEIILCTDTKQIKDQDLAPIIKLMRYGANYILEMPGFDEEILIYAQRSLGQYCSRKQVFDDYSKDSNFLERMNAFFDIVEKRKSRGLPVTLQEMEMFFPRKHKNMMALEELLSKVNKPPIKEFGDISILIVEDEKDKMDHYIKYLGRFGYKLICEKTFKGAIQAVEKTQKIDIAILDIGLDDGDGNNLIPHIKEFHPNCEVIMMTAWERLDLVMSCLKRGAFDYLIKEKSGLAAVAQKVIQAIHKQNFDQMVFDHMKFHVPETQR